MERVVVVVVAGEPLPGCSVNNALAVASRARCFQKELLGLKMPKVCESPANTGPCPAVLVFRVPGTVAGLPTGELMRCTALSSNLFFDPALIVLLEQPAKRHRWQGNSLLKRRHER